MKANQKRWSFEIVIVTQISRCVYLIEPFAAFAELLSGEISKKVDNQEVKKEAGRLDDYRQLVETLKLGIACEDVALDKLDSASAAVCCFPMYMVANAGTLVDDPQTKANNAICWVRRELGLAGIDT